MNHSQRDSALKLFREERRILLMSTKAGARGLNLQNANHVYHFDFSWNPVDAWQGEARCWRLGQKRLVHVRSFVQKNTIEERIQARLALKKSDIERTVEGLADSADEEGDESEEVENLVNQLWSKEELTRILQPSI